MTGVVQTVFRAINRFCRVSHRRTVYSGWPCVEEETSDVTRESDVYLERCVQRCFCVLGGGGSGGSGVWDLVFTGWESRRSCYTRRLVRDSTVREMLKWGILRITMNMSIPRPYVARASGQLRGDMARSRPGCFAPSHSLRLQYVIWIYTIICYLRLFLLSLMSELVWSA